MSFGELSGAVLGPSFSGGDLAGLMAFAADLVVGPLTAVVLIVALLLRKWSGWTPVLVVLALVNIVIASTMLLTVADGLGPFVPLVGFQAVVSVGLLVALTRPQFRAKLRGP